MKQQSRWRHLILTRTCKFTGKYLVASLLLNIFCFSSIHMNWIGIAIVFVMCYGVQYVYHLAAHNKYDAQIAVRQGVLWAVVVATLIMCVSTKTWFWFVRGDDIPFIGRNEFAQIMGICVGICILFLSYYLDMIDETIGVICALGISTLGMWTSLYSDVSQHLSATQTLTDVVISGIVCIGSMFMIISLHTLGSTVWELVRSEDK